MRVSVKFVHPWSKFFLVVLYLCLRDKLARQCELWFEGGERQRHINASLLYFLPCEITFLRKISLCYFLPKEKGHKVFWDPPKTFPLRKNKRAVPWND